MSNMSYCRFQNTLPDLEDCMDALDEGEFDELSNNEREAALELIALCGQIYETYMELLDEDAQEDDEDETDE